MKYVMIAFTIFITGCASLNTADLSNPQKREAKVNAYLTDFCSPAFHQSLIGPAIHDVMMRLSPEDLKIILNRRRPVIFVEAYDAGTGKYASSNEIIMTKNERPAFQEGMTIVKISTALENGSKEAVMGVVAHELANRVLDHVRRGKVTCKSERESNRLVKAWGFGQEFEAAKREFGREKEGSGVASCQEE